MRTLLVDDSNTMRRIQRNILESLQIKEVDEAVDGADAFEKMGSGNYDLVLLDWNMPKMDGFSFLQTIRSMEKFKSTKIIMVTSESEKTKILEAIKAGANHYIVKPFTAEVLMTKLRDLKMAV